MPTTDRSDKWWTELTVGHAAGVVRGRASDARRTPFGWMLHAPAVPHVWAVNRAQVVPGAGGLDPADTVTAIEAAHDAAGLTHRAVDLRSAGDARRLGAVLRAAGYLVVELAVMVADPAELSERTRPRPGRRWAVAPYGPGAGQDVRRAAGAMETARGEQEREQVAVQWSAAPAADATHLVARSDVGEAVGVAVVHRGSLHLELDDVLTHPAHERSGVGTAVLRAVAGMGTDRGAEGITLLADPNSSAASWYQRRGFRRVGATFQAHRDAAD